MPTAAGRMEATLPRAGVPRAPAAVTGARARPGARVFARSGRAVRAPPSLSSLLSGLRGTCSRRRDFWFAAQHRCCPQEAAFGSVPILPFFTEPLPQPGHRAPVQCGLCTQCHRPFLLPGGPNAGFRLWVRDTQLYSALLSTTVLLSTRARSTHLCPPLCVCLQASQGSSVLL